MVKNPKWQEAGQLTIYKRGRRIELGATERQLQQAARAGLEPDRSSTLPPPVPQRSWVRFPFKAEFFFRLSFRNCLSYVHNCDGYSSIHLIKYS